MNHHRHHRLLRDRTAVERNFDPDWPHGHITENEGLPARIICRDAKGVSPIVALINRKCGDELTYRFRKNGSAPSGAYALVNAPAPVIHDEGSQDAMDQASTLYLELRTLSDTKVLTHGGEKTRRRLELRINGAVIDRFEEGSDDVKYYCGNDFDQIVLERVELFETALGIQAVRTVAPARSLMDDALMAALKERKAEAEAHLARIEEIIATTEGRS